MNSICSAACSLDVQLVALANAAVTSAMPLPNAAPTPLMQNAMPDIDPNGSAYERALHRLLEVTSSPRFGLERMQALLAALGNPHHNFEALHVAGTNGKGSTVAFAQALCSQAGVKVGRTTSPHLTAATERIAIDDVDISRSTFVALEDRVFHAAKTIDDPPTFYERMVAMAFTAFADANVGLALVEVGLGGRLDATNVVRSRACAITSIALDHTQFLGDTIAKIAREKAGIIKALTPVVTTTQHPDALAAIEFVAKGNDAPITVAPPHIGRLGLAGPHQADNAGLALALVRNAGVPLSDDDVSIALASAAWPGRMEWMRPRSIVLDGAHNDAAAIALGRALNADARSRDAHLHLVVGATRGHDPASFCAALSNEVGPRISTVVATCARAPRSVEAATVAPPWRLRCGEDVVTVRAVDEAIDAANHRAGEGDVVVVTGSLYLVGELRATLVEMPQDPVLPDF